MILPKENAVLGRKHAKNAFETKVSRFFFYFRPNGFALFDIWLIGVHRKISISANSGFPSRPKITENDTYIISMFKKN